MNQKVDFTSKLVQQKNLIDSSLQKHSKDIQTQASRSYTPYSRTVVDAYVSVLERGGKRIRGVLTTIGYEMCNGQDVDMIVDAACAIEMTHAYILVLDDIMDKSEVRRGGSSAHVMLADYHKQQGLAAESLHFGEAVAINAALIGCHYAQTVVTKLAVSADVKIKALQLLNESLVVTGHGQINDIFNEVIDTVDARAVDNVLEWKTAHYTFLNPLQFGMALAGASDKQLKAVHNYCMAAGRAFQITDDILGTFASELEAGKSPMDDIREGKRTVLSIAALTQAKSSDKNFLITMLGNEKLTPAEFTRCKEIFVESGALESAQKQAEALVKEAKQSLQQNAHLLSEDGVAFLDQLVSSLLGRST